MCKKVVDPILLTDYFVKRKSITTKVSLVLDGCVGRDLEAMMMTMVSTENIVVLELHEKKKKKKKNHGFDVRQELLSSSHHALPIVLT